MAFNSNNVITKQCELLIYNILLSCSNTSRIVCSVPSLIILPLFKLSPLPIAIKFQCPNFHNSCSSFVNFPLDIMPPTLIAKIQLGPKYNEGKLYLNVIYEEIDFFLYLTKLQMLKIQCNLHFHILHLAPVKISYIQAALDSQYAFYKRT